MKARSARRALALGVGLAGVAAASAMIAGAGEAAQPSSERAREREYAAWIPPGTYTAIIVCSSGEQRRWAVSLETLGFNVPIVVRPGENAIVPFEQGWTVHPGDEARMTSRLVPFADAARHNLVGERSDFVLSAWGITAGGPVAFVYRDVK